MDFMDIFDFDYDLVKQARRRNLSELNSDIFLRDFGRYRLREKKTDKEISITIEVPGYSEEDISVEIDNSLLYISIGSEESKRWYEVPSGYNGKEATASVTNGLLVIVIPAGSSTLKKIL
jgi:HSP20 family molecular chaperone IbpA